jgi:hypothetical protein
MHPDADSALIAIAGPPIDAVEALHEALKTMRSGLKGASDRCPWESADVETGCPD